MKSVSRNKLLLCFRPVVNMDLMLESEAVLVDRSQKHKALKYVGVKKEEEGRMKPSTSTNKSSVSDTENSIMLHRRTGKKRFSQVIKAVFFEILLAKRVRDRKGIDRGSNSLSSHDKLLDTSVGKSVNNVLAISRSNLVLSISSCSSSSSSSSNSTHLLHNNKSPCQEQKRKPKQERKDRDSSSNSVLLLLLICLALTIFGGKIFAILFTSIWLYFIPHLQPKAVIGNLENIKSSPEKMSGEYKKKVIIYGLLERNHNRGASSV